MINITSLEQLAEDMDSAITPVTILLGKTMKDLWGGFCM